VSSLVVNSGQSESREAEWARLIPGEMPPFRATAKKGPRSVSPMALRRMGRPAESRGQDGALSLLIPSPMQGRMGVNWLWCMCVDGALVALNWLLIGALLVPLRELFPQIRTFGFDAGKPGALLGVAFLHFALVTLVAYTEGLQVASGDPRKQVKTLAKAVLFANTVMCCAYGLQGASWGTAVLICAAGLLHLGAMWLWRWQRFGRARTAPSPRLVRNVLIVGSGTVGRKVASSVERDLGSRRRVCGFLDDERPLGNGVVGRISDLALMARKGFVDEVILAAPRDGDVTQRVLRDARRLRLDVEIVPELFGCNPAGPPVECVGSLPIISLHAERLPDASLVLKRVIDVVGASLALAVLSPLIAVIAVLIKLDSQGTVLYCAQRAGRKQRHFRCYKFRTMVTEAEQLKDALRGKNERSGPMFKIAGDPRITRLGRLLRRYSLDELPQLWNVVKGDMSLVGPRPHPLDDVAAYEIEHLGRLDVTPGLTGLWQVTARRDPSFQRGMELDREYIRTWSLGLDLRILMRTMVTVVRGSGQ